MNRRTSGILFLVASGFLSVVGCATPNDVASHKPSAVTDVHGESSRLALPWLDMLGPQADIGTFACRIAPVNSPLDAPRAFLWAYHDDPVTTETWAFYRPDLNTGTNDTPPPGKSAGLNRFKPDAAEREISISYVPIEVWAGSPFPDNPTARATFRTWAATTFGYSLDADQEHDDTMLSTSHSVSNETASTAPHAGLFEPGVYEVRSGPTAIAWVWRHVDQQSNVEHWITNQNFAEPGKMNPALTWSVVGWKAADAPSTAGGKIPVTSMSTFEDWSTNRNGQAATGPKYTHHYTLGWN